MQAITNRKLIVSLLALAAVALLLVALSATSDSGGTDSSRAQAPALAADDAAASQFSVLDPSASESDVPPPIASVLEELPGSGGQGDGVVTALGVVPGGTASSEVVVAEVSGQVCLFASGTDYQGAAVGSCFSITTAEAGKAYVAVQGVEPGETRVLGLAPDGVENVSIDSGSNGSAEEVASVDSNVYEADLPKEPTTVTGRDASGDVQYQTEMPLATSGG